MSYCRWSSDDFQCDLHCYEAEDGYVTHVASRRYIIKEELPPIKVKHRSGWAARQELVLRIIRNSELVPIGLPCDGKCYKDETLKEIRDRVAGLIAMGYHAPSKVLKTIDAELKENGGVK